MPLVSDHGSLIKGQVGTSSISREETADTYFRIPGNYSKVDFKRSSPELTDSSCVRSRARFVDADKAANMGFINERKRFNVAITRAKEILVVIGNANLLKVTISSTY